MTLPPNAESAAVAVEALRGELDMIDRALEAIDRKAALVPAVLGALAAFFVNPETVLSSNQRIAFIAGLVVGGISIAYAIRTMWARLLHVGPNAQTTSTSTHLKPADFNRAVAGSLADSVDAMSHLAQTKGDYLNRSFVLAALALLAFALVRIV
jgi:hypothetical protein